MDFPISPRQSSSKVVASRHYSHVVALLNLPAAFQALANQAIALAGVTSGVDFNVLRIDPREQSVALLDYPGFDSDACPRLNRSWKVSIPRASVGFRTYADSLNPPILHRKELLLSADDPRREEWGALTRELESLGVFDDPVKIGFQNQWGRLLAELGFRLVGNQLIPIGNDETTEALGRNEEDDPGIARYRTALTRHTFSAPIQLLWKLGFIQGAKTVFDYGCGKGDDLRGLTQQGIAAAGWDPYFAADRPIKSAEIVNLGFVINVIEDPVERREALTRAYSLCTEALVVSAMLANDNEVTGVRFADGVLTQRRTFQKYYTQAELRHYLETTLSVEAIALAPGIFIVFRDPQAQQRFQLERTRGKTRLPRLTHRVVRMPRPPGATAAAKTKRSPKPDLYAANREALDALWHLCLDLGRRPDPSEIPDVANLEAALGSLNKAMKLVFERNDAESFQKARTQRTDDLCVYFAMQFFDRRPAHTRFEPRLQRDIRAFFGSYLLAKANAHTLLVESASPERIKAAATVAAEQGLGWLEGESSLQLHTSLLPRLPAVLRAYVGCAATLYGDAVDADLVKIHIESGKVSFLKFVDFMENPLPRMIERVKVNLRTQFMQHFEYGGAYPPPFLYLKSRYLNEELPHYAEQVRFDEQLQTVPQLDLSGHGPSEAEFLAVLKAARWQIEGFQLVRDRRIPELDEHCGRYLTYRQLIECGETQQATHLPNLPKTPDSYTALYELATQVLDPVIEYFGMIKLTYGFCSPELARAIPGRIDPRVDQHSAHELNRAGRMICSRLGAAVDFQVEDENMRDVREWMAANLAFDRLYFYGVDRPIHVSYGPELKAEIIEMRLGPNGRLIPRVLKKGTYPQPSDTVAPGLASDTREPP